MRQFKPKSERLEARISPEQKNLFQHAANLAGRTLTDFAVNALLEAANKIVREHEVIQLSQRDQHIFAQALFKPPKPHKRLLQAAKRYRKVIEK